MHINHNIRREINSSEKNIGFLDSMIHFLGGALLGSAFIGVLVATLGIQDGDFARIAGIAAGVVVVGVLKAKKVL